MTSADRCVDSAIADIQMVAAVVVYRLIAAIVGMHIRVAVASLQKPFSAARIHLLAATALAAGDRVKFAASQLAVVDQGQLEDFPYISPSMTSLYVQTT